jgi:hypothetical protein
MFVDALRVWPQGCSFAVTLSLSEAAAAGGELVTLLETGGRLPRCPGFSFDLEAHVDAQPLLPVRNDQAFQAGESGLFAHGCGRAGNRWQEEFWLTPVPRGDVLHLAIMGDLAHLGGRGSIDISAFS